MVAAAAVAASKEPSQKQTKIKKNKITVYEMVGLYDAKDNY